MMILRKKNDDPNDMQECDILTLTMHLGLSLKIKMLTLCFYTHG